MIIGSNKSRLFRASWQARNSGRVDIAVLSLKSVGQASTLRTQTGVNIIYSFKLKSIGRLEIRAGFLCYSLEAEFLP